MALVALVCTADAGSRSGGPPGRSAPGQCQRGLRAQAMESELQEVKRKDYDFPALALAQGLALAVTAGTSRVPRAGMVPSLLALPPLHSMES